MTRMSFKGFTRPAIAVTLATALTLSPMSAAPARADSRSDALAAAAFLTLFLGGVAIASQNQGGARWDGGNNGRGDNGRGGRGDARKALPARCVMNVNRGTFYRTRCLKRNFNNWAYLPSRCEVRVQKPNGRKVNAYKGRCLERFGYYERGDRRGRSN